MDQTLHSPEVYDFRKYDRIWQRVAPTLEPYPEEEERSAAIRTPDRQREDGAMMQPVMRQEGQLPGAEINPCCMGSAAADLLEVLTGFVEEELEERRQLLALSQRAPSWARQKLRDMACEEESHARRLMAVYYLITGECYQPRIHCERIRVERWCAALRERYHDQACSGLNYGRAADETTDLCLQRLLAELSADEYRHADQLLRILEKALGR